jgi:hypothetical protein
MANGSAILAGLLGLRVLTTMPAVSQATVYAVPAAQVELSGLSVLVPAQYRRYVGPRYIGLRGFRAHPPLGAATLLW